MVVRLQHEGHAAGGNALEEQIVMVVNSFDTGEVAAYCRLLAFLDEPDGRHQVLGCFVLFESKQSGNDLVLTEQPRNNPIAIITSLWTGSPESLKQSAE